MPVRSRDHMAIQQEMRETKIRGALNRIVDTTIIYCRSSTTDAKIDRKKKCTNATTVICNYNL